MNVFNILKRKLGMVTVPELQKVASSILTTVEDNTPTFSLPYKVFSANIYINGLNPIGVNILQNTLGGVPTFTPTVEDYRITLVGAFTLNKTQVFVGPNMSYGPFPSKLVVGALNNVDTIRLLNYRTDPDAIINNTIQVVSDLFTTIEIRVYE